MLDFFITTWLIIVLIVEIPKLIQDLKRTIKGDIRLEDIAKFLLY